MMKKYIMALDQGTTSSRCILFDEAGRVASVAQKEFPQLYPFPGWVEQDPMEIWGSQMGVAQEAMHQIGADYRQISAIGITNQRETTIVWDRATGKPVCNAIVWQCRRTAPFCNQLIEQGYADLIHKKTGLPIDAYFSGTKLRWILDHVPSARERAEKGELAFGTVDTWLLWNLTKGKVHATDYSNASRTMLFDINRLRWDEELLEILDIPRSLLPEVHPSSALYGETDPLLFGGPIPVHAVLGDQQSALYGHECCLPGTAKNTYGTGGFLLMNTGEKPVYSEKGLLTTVAWNIDGQVTYALEGSVFVAGAAVQWLRDELKLLDSSADSDSMAISVPDSNEVYFVPAFVGLGAPYWDSSARGTIVGLTRGVNRNHIVRATLEAIAYQTVDVLSIMEEESDIRLSTLKVDGGASGNGFLMQFQADLIDVSVERPANREITAWGTAKLAGESIGYFREQVGSQDQNRSAVSFIPSMDPGRRQELKRGWRRAVQTARFWSSAGQKEEESL